MNFLEPQAGAEGKDEYLNEVYAEEEVRFGPMGDAQEKQVVVRDPFDPSFIPAIFRPFHAEVDKIANIAQGFKIVDVESNKLASMYGNQSQQLINALNKATKKAGEPYKNITDILADENKGLTGRLKTVKAIFDEGVTKFLFIEEQKRKEAEKKAKEERDRLQAELDRKAQKDRALAAQEAREKAEAEGLSKKKQEEAAKAAAAMVEEAPTIVMEMPAETKVSTEAGSAKIKEQFVGVLTDIRLIPDDCIQSRWNELVKAVQPFINAQIASGKRTVPGFEIKKIVKLETRATAHKGYEKF